MQADPPVVSPLLARAKGDRLRTFSPRAADGRRSPRTCRAPRAADTPPPTRGSGRSPRRCGGPRADGPEATRRIRPRPRARGRAAPPPRSYTALTVARSAAPGRMVMAMPSSCISATREPRRDAGLVVEDRAVDLAADAAHLVEAGRPLHEGHVGARLEIGVGAADGLVEAAAVRAARVGAGDQHEVGIDLVPRRGRRAVLADRLLERDDLPARHVAAALGNGLVLEVDARDARLDVFAHRADHVDGVAVAVVGVRDHGHGRRRWRCSARSGASRSSWRAPRPASRAATATCRSPSCRAAGKPTSARMRPDSAL